MKTSLTRGVDTYLRAHPSVRQSLQNGIVNYSALARIICGRRISEFQGTVVALRRAQQRLQKRPSFHLAQQRLLKSAKLRVRTKVTVAAVEKPQDHRAILDVGAEIRQLRGDCTLVEGEQVFTIITNDEYRRLVERKCGPRVLEIRSGLVELLLVFSKGIVTTPGIVAHLYSILAERGINILEEVSCWTELMLVIDPQDLPLALEILQQTQQQEE